ncbi:Ubiquitin [Oryctes borbonicus]|uniref:Ubiquitin n=1 Tax=Oryctes borbonicus TaxID=1629725 RepID=A0A0T6AXD4_9SCAR|nr:Ubiquitin [Oryctes borbonicus]
MEIAKDSGKNESEKLLLTVKSSARKEVVEVPSNSTIHSFKEVIADKFSADVHSLRLIYAGRILKDTDTFASLNIKNGYTIYVVVRTPMQSNSNLSNDAIPSHANISSALSRNILQHYVNSPDILRSIINNNPAMQQLIQRNPEVGHVFNNPTLLREAMEVMRNPNVADEFVRSADRAMNNIESLPGGFNALQQIYQDIEEPLISATNDSPNPFINLFTSTETSNQQGTENREPLPNPWSPNESINSETNNALLINNPLIQNMLDQLQDHIPQNQSNTSFQPPQDLEDLLSDITESGEYANLQQQNLPNRPVDIGEHYRTQMQQLIEMGFVNQEANLQALVASFGDLNRAIEMLLSRNLMN